MGRNTQTVKGCLVLLLVSFAAFGAVARPVGPAPEEKPQGIADQPSFTCGTCPAGYTGLNGAGWNVCYQITGNHGIAIRNACFQSKTVLFEGTQPFVINPYRNNPPSPTYKDGIGARCGGTGFTFIPGTLHAAVETDDDNPGYPAFAGYPGGPSYNKIDIGATFHLGWYRYRQRWIFHGTGEFEAQLGLGGYLAPGWPGREHFHSAYWRLDFDVDVSTPNYVEEFQAGLDLRMPSAWYGVANEGVRYGFPASFTKWRARSNLRNAQNQLHTWEIETIYGATNEYATGEFWPVVRYASEDGTVVGTAGCDDRELDTVYSTPQESLNGVDVVLWIAQHHHHEPRNLGEESPRMPGFEWIGIKASPRNFGNSTP